MKRRAIVTIATQSYTHFALALADSVREHEADAEFFVCFADSTPPEIAQHVHPENQFEAQDLGIPNWQRMAFQYTPFELSCALKPFVMQHLVQLGYEEIIYLDADMRLLGPLAEVTSAFQSDSIVLTPHLIRPLPEDGKIPGEDLFLVAGTFNAGFVGIRNDQHARAFLEWWSNRLKSECYKDLAGSIFVDQKWLSLVPGLFENVHILRHPGYNTGHWTLSQFSLSGDHEHGFAVDGKPLALFHFSNLCPGKCEAFHRSQNRMKLHELPALQELVSTFHTALQIYDQDGVFSKLACRFNSLSDGTPIHPSWREAVRRNHPSVEAVSDPFDVSAHPNLKTVFDSLQGQSHKWRKDWRLKPPNIAQQKLKKKLKSWMKTVGLRKAA